MKKEFLKKSAPWKVLFMAVILMTGTAVSSCDDKTKEEPGKTEDAWVKVDKSSHQMAEGETLSLTPTFSDDATKALTYKWTSSDESVATVTGDKSGATVTAVSAGTVVIKIECTSDTKITAQCSLTVTEEAQENWVSLDKTTHTMEEGETVTLTPTFSSDETKALVFEWTSSDETVASVSGDKDGATVTAVAAGTANIKITCTTDATITAQCVLTITEKEVLWVSLDKTTHSMDAGGSVILTPSFSSNAVKAMTFEWTSSDTDVAKLVENSDGSVMVIGLSAGTATVTIECTTDETITADCEVTVNAVADDGIIRILAIGNSFSQDAVEQYLWNLADAEGIEVVIGNMYIGGCSLEKHVTNINSDAAAYAYRKIVNGSKTEKSSIKLSTTLAEERWDYISLQQVSGYSGIYDSYAESLPTLAEYVRERATNPDMKLMLHQTWAYASSSTHTDFPKYNSDQMTMYNSIIDATTRAAELVDIDIVIPAGTAIQNGRSSYLGDTFCNDGYHLETTYGRYTAACTWFEKIFGENVVGNTYAPDGLHSYIVEIAQTAAHTAVETPGQVTDMVDYKNPPVDTEVLKAPVKIDFGNSTTASSADGWNEIRTAAVTETPVQLLDEEGDYTNLTLSITDAFSSLYQGVGSEKNIAYTTSFTIPLAAYSDGLLVDATDDYGEIVIGNLDPSLEYTMTIIGLRWNSGVERTTDYIVKGSGTSTNYPLAIGVPNSDQGALDAANKYITIDTISPDDSGNITVGVTRGTDSSGTPNPHQGVINAIYLNLATQP